MTSLLIVARAPRPGEVKTRLEPRLGPEGCARLQAELIRHTAAWASDAASRAWLAFTPSHAGAEMAALVPDRVILFPQTSGDLGGRLQDATDRIFREQPAALIVVVPTRRSLVSRISRRPAAPSPTVTTLAWYRRSTAATR